MAGSLGMKVIIQLPTNTHTHTHLSLTVALFQLAGTHTAFGDTLFGAFSEGGCERVILGEQRLH